MILSVSFLDVLVALPTHSLRSCVVKRKTINVAPDAAASVLYFSPVTSSAQADSTSELLRFL
ncbi:Uncharacterised protein [uncultured Avibacterium sp.]|uniref:Uncharacterized protein n=1 Tax=uncultured Avibacterium sp. TaxID=1936169 RepID=A0A486XG55_9PAST|nr:Uncharacterised protein [uncultured Avibacterium sp.]